MTKKHIFCRLLNMAISMALWTKVITCEKAGFKSRFCQVHQAGKIGVNQRNLRLINDLRFDKALYISRDSFTDVISALQIAPILTNKANFLDDQMNVSSFITKNYEQRTINYEIKNKPNSNPKQTQFKPNTKPIRTQFKPKQTQSQPVQPTGRAKEWELDFWLSNLFDLQICLNRPKYSKIHDIHDLIAWSVVKRNCRCRRICNISNRFVELKGINHENQRSYQNVNCSDCLSAANICLVGRGSAKATQPQ